MNRHIMTTHSSRRDMLKGTLAVTSLALLNIPEWALPRSHKAR